jgi:hypothetical protein
MGKERWLRLTYFRALPQGNALKYNSLGQRPRCPEEMIPQAEGLSYGIFDSGLGAHAIARL